MRIQTLLIATALVTTLASCGGGGGGDSDSGTSSDATTPSGGSSPGTNNEVRVSKVGQVLSADQTITQIRSLDNGFGIAGNRILGTTIDGRQWQIHYIKESFYDINGSAGKYSAMGHVICSKEGGALSTDGGTTWQLGEELGTCGTESWLDGSLQYSDGAWISNRGFSIDGLNYRRVALDDKTYFPSAWSSTKASGRTTGTVYIFNESTCSVWVGEAPFNYTNWKQAGTYRTDNSTTEKFSPCARYDTDVEWFPGKPYIQFGRKIADQRNESYYMTAPPDSRPENWVWTIHEAPGRSENQSHLPSINDMFWVGDALVAIISSGFFVSEDNGNTWNNRYPFRQYPDLQKINRAAYNCNTGIIAASDGKNLFEVSLPGLKPSPGIDCNGGQSSGGTPVEGTPSDGGGANPPYTAAPLAGTHWVNPVLRNDQQSQGSGLFVKYQLPQSQQGVSQELADRIIHCMSTYESTVQLPPALVPGLLGPETFSLFGATPQDICMQRQKTWDSYFSKLDEVVQQCSGMSLPGIEMTITNPITNVTINTVTEQPPSWAGIKSFANISYAQHMADNGCP